MLSAAVTDCKFAILLIEDNVDLSMLMRLQLKVSGYDCTVAATLAQARQYLAGNHYDCIIIDLLLPDGDGMTLVDEIHNLMPACRIIVASGNVYPDLYRDPRIYRIFEKPYNFDDLRQCLSN